MVNSVLIYIECDDNVIFKAIAVEGRYVVTGFVLWVPKMMLNGRGENIFLHSYLKPHTWSYLKERVEIIPTTKQQGSTLN